jgi:hypothetical protein
MPMDKRKSIRRISQKMILQMLLKCNSWHFKGVITPFSNTYLVLWKRCSGYPYNTDPYLGRFLTLPLSFIFPPYPLWPGFPLSLPLCNTACFMNSLKAYYYTNNLMVKNNCVPSIHFGRGEVTIVISCLDRSIQM